MKIKQFFKKLAWNMFLGATLFHVGTEACYTARQAYLNRNPSRLRQEFYEQFWIPLSGWEEDVEDNSELVSKISEELHRHQILGAVPLKKINVESRNYLKKSFLEQVRFILHGRSRNTAGYYNSESKTIDVFRNTGSGSISHEIAHSKVDYGLEENPGLLERFERISVDRNGKSLYNERKGRKLEDLTEEEREFGFLTEYSITSPAEDLAESSRYEQIPEELLFEEIFVKKNPKLLEKIRYAKELRIIPYEFEDYVRIKCDYKEFDDEQKAREFLKYTDEFLHRNSGSVYECGIHDLRSRVLKHLDQIECFRDGKKADYELARRELIKGLKSRFKDREEYTSALFNLRMIYNLRGEKSKADVVSEASKEYEKRYSNGKPNLSYVGVNDFLEENGISLDVHESRRLDSIVGGKDEK